MEQSRFDPGPFGLDDLRLLAALAAAGSLAGAARRLGVNHASAWRRLGALETRLGVRLFERGRAGYAPTPAGEDAAAAAADTLRVLGELGRRLAGHDGRLEGGVRLTTTDTFLDLLMPALATLKGTHPGIVVDVVTDRNFFTLTRRDADIALRPAATAPEELVARRLSEIGVAIYAAADGPLVPGTAPAALDWVALDDSLSHSAMYRWLVGEVPRERVKALMNSVTGLAAAARAGVGAAALPCYVGDVDPRLKRLSPTMPEMASNLWLITHPDLRRTPRIRAVLDHLAAYFGGMKALISGRAG